MTDDPIATAPTFGVDGMADSSTAMPHDAMDDIINGATFTQDESPLEDDAHLYDEFLRSEMPQMDEVDPSLLEPRKRTPTARKYERKTAGLISLAAKITMTQPPLVSDSATLLMHGPNVAEKMGDLAATNQSVARVIDMLTDNTENPATAAILATAPLVLQILRNHEPIIEKQREKPARTFRIPFTKRAIRLRIGFRLGKRMKNMTQDPVALRRYVFTQPAIIDALQKQGLSVPDVG